ncbi:MAG: hypothetical protein IK014_03505 [Lachnospiraceae bacterium]|nr:hypothetical protein [Lachnospiraceae bacterium]
MKVTYDIFEDETLCGDVCTELVEVSDGYHWSYEYMSDKYFKHIEADFSDLFEINKLQCEMVVGEKKISVEIIKSQDGESSYEINGKKVFCNSRIVVFEMIFLLNYKNVFENSVIYNPLNNEFVPMNIKGKGDKYTVLFPSLCDIVIENNKLVSCIMPRDEMQIIMQE